MHKTFTLSNLPTLLLVSTLLFFLGSHKVFAIAPGGTNLSAAETYTEDVSLNLIDIVASDIDSTTVTAVITLSNISAGSLSTATSGSVTSTYISGTGVWTASGLIADVNTLLAGLTFTPTTNFNSSFTMATTISDGTESVSGTKVITGTAVNDAPVLDSSKSPVLATVVQDASAPTGAVGTLVSTLVDFASPAGQVDNVTDVDSGAALGIAIVATSSSLTCYYSINGGGTWLSLGTPSIATARLLSTSSNNRIYCIAGVGVSGTFADAITLRAWDQSTGTDGGTLNTVASGGTQSTSSATDMVSLTVTSGNAAPGGTNLSTAETYTEDTPLNLIDIVVSDTDNTSLTATLTLSNPLAGSLNTARSGAVTSTYNSGTGVWTASGLIADINTLLSNLTFTPASNFNSSFSVSTRVADNVQSVSGTKSFTGIAVNDNPLAVDDTYTIIENSGAVAHSVLTNDTDPESDTLTLSALTTTPSLGTATIAGNTIVYEPDVDTCGTDTIDYTVVDRTTGTDTGRATFTITCDIPTVVSVTPTDGSMHQNPTTTLTIQFSKPMNTNSLVISTNPCTLSGCPTYTEVWSLNNTTVTLTKVGDLFLKAETYDVEIMAERPSGDQLASPYDWSFTIVPEATSRTNSRKVVPITTSNIKIDTPEVTPSIKTACPLSQTLTQNLRAGTRNGVYDAYAKALVTDATKLQAHLNRLGFASGPEDGILGPRSRAAIQRMQKFFNTTPDGYVGPLTRALINNSCK